MDKYLSEHTVTRKAMRPASKKEECFYCNQKIGEKHFISCVLIHKKVTKELTVKVPVEYECPNDWSNRYIEKESNHCAGNHLEQIIEYFKDREIKGMCLCENVVNIKVIETLEENYLGE